MAEKILMIALSPTMEEGLLVKWMKEEGQDVTSGDVLCEVETDKAAMDYESTFEGILLKILVQAGQKAAVGDLIAIVGEKGEDIGELLTESKNAQDKAEPETQSKAEPIPEEIDNQEQPKKKSEAQSDKDQRTKASPLARSLAEKQGLSLDAIKGSGPNGRIVKADIEAAAQLNKTQTSTSPSQTVLAAKDQDEVIPVSGKRKIIAKRLAQSKYSAPHYYLKISVSTQGMLTARQRLNEKAKEKVSLNAFIIKFVAEAIKKHPFINSTWNEDNILRHGSVDIGLAVALPDGLITPVVQNCVEKGIVAIEAELKGLIPKALNNTLKPEEYQGATFTISNLGSFGIEEFTAIINPPGSAILAVGESRKVPVVLEDGTIGIDTVMKLTLSCDHRVIDGAVGAAFLKTLKDIIEQPIQALY